MEIREIVLGLQKFFSDINPFFLGSLVFIFGAVFGSFINVLIYRLPLEIDIIYKPSFCPKCNNPIKWHHNIPIFSYIFLKGKCYYCSNPIPISYLIIELFSGFSFLGFYILFGITWDFFVLCLFFIISLPVLVIDLKHHIIPDELSVGGTILGIILGILHNFIGFQNNSNITINFFDSLFGILVGLLIFGSIYFLSLWIFRKEGMGMGDVKFATTIGAFLGSYPAIIAFLLSFIYGSIIGIFITVFKRLKNYKKIKAFSLLKDYSLSIDYLTSIVKSYVYESELDQLKSSYIAFGPYMVLGAWTSIFFSNFIVDFFVGGII